MSWGRISRILRRTSSGCKRSIFFGSTARTLPKRGSSSDSSQPTWPFFPVSRTVSFIFADTAVEDRREYRQVSDSAHPCRKPADAWYPRRRSDEGRSRAAHARRPDRRNSCTCRETAPDRSAPENHVRNLPGYRLGFAPSRINERQSIRRNAASHAGCLRRHRGLRLPRRGTAWPADAAIDNENRAASLSRNKSGYLERSNR